VPALADAKNSMIHAVPHLLQWRRPELYAELADPLSSSAASAVGMPGPCTLPADAPAASETLKLAVMQISRHHTRACTEWQTTRQIQYAAARGAHLGVLPELFCFTRDEVDSGIAADPLAAATYSAHVLALLTAACAEHALWLYACTAHTLSTPSRDIACQHFSLKVRAWCVSCTHSHCVHASSSR
jgi:hypothetical protein